MKKGLLLILYGSLSFANELEISVSLSPAGSFLIKSEQVISEGELQVQAQGFKVKKVSVPIDSLKTGIELRDEHMKKKYLEIERFPQATLLEGQGSQGKFLGKLEVHGVIRPVSGVYQIVGNSLATQFKCRLSEFKIKEANYMGVGVDDEVSVSVNLKGK